MSRNPRHDEPAYWDEKSLRSEMGRVLEICQGCRRCWNLCPSFGNVFKRIDELDEQLNGPTPAAPAAHDAAGAKAKAGPADGVYAADGHAALPDPSLASIKDPLEALTDADHRRLVDECYQCKLCFNLCPYHPPHRFQLDFPRLMQRAKAVRVKNEGMPLRDRLFSRVDLIGRANSWVAELVNWANARPAPRALLEKVLGIHRERNLPLFFRETFRRWWDWRGPKARRAGRVVLFYTCTVNYNDPGIGKAAVAVLERNGFEVVCPPQECCGMPHLDAGGIAPAQRAAARNVARLLPYAQQGLPILALGPSCSLMLKEEYPQLLDTEAARLVAKATRDIHEYLIELKKAGRLDLDFLPAPGPIAYQPPCHLKAQNIGLKSKEALELLPGAKISLVDRCSAHDGTWSMKTEFYQLSMKTGRKLFAEIEAAQPQLVSTDCPLAGLQIKQGTGRAPLHPIQILARAYGHQDD